MDVRYKLYKDSGNVDLRPHQSIIRGCFQTYFPGYKIVVKEHEIIIQNYPDDTLPRTALRKVSEELMTYQAIQPYIHEAVSKRLLTKISKKS